MAEYVKKADVLQIINNARDGDSLFAMMQILMLPPIESKVKALQSIEIPTPHGRLIDADALIEDLKRQCKEVFRIDAVSPDDYWIKRDEAYREALWKDWVESFGEYLKTRPTIIEAEE